MMDALRAAFVAGTLGLVAFLAWRFFGPQGQGGQGAALDEYSGDFAWEGLEPGTVRYVSADPAPASTWPAWMSSAADTVTASVGAIFGAGDASTGGMRLSAEGLDRIKRHEAFRATQYYDQAGKLTIGYGHLVKPLELFGTLTEAEALALLASDVAIAESAVNSGVRVAITQAQFDALVSLAFNIGAGAFARSSVLRRLNQGDIQGAAAAFGLWNKVTINGALVASNGLTARRAAEAQLFMDGSYG